MSELTIITFVAVPLRRGRRGRAAIRPSLSHTGGILLGFLLILTFVLTASQPATAQEPVIEDVPTVTKTVAIRNARIVQAPGDVLERATIVMQDGLITDVGADVAIPYDADVIEGDSLVIYAGFIDGLSHTAIPKPETEQGDEPVNPADPPRSLAGIEPHVLAREHLDPDHESVDALRRLGFAVAHVVPHGRMLPGSGSIVLLTGDDPADMVLRPDVSLFMQFAGGPGVYPATPMGIIAQLRQLFREAERSRVMERLYAENPAGIGRPSYDPVHEALHPLLSGEKPLFVSTTGGSSALEVHRALHLREELGFSLALAGLNQGFDVVATLQEAAIPLFLTLGLPARPDTLAADSTAESAPDTDEAPPDAAAPDAAAPEAAAPGAPDADKAAAAAGNADSYDPELRTRTYADVDREKENLAARRAASRARYVGTARMLHDAGLRFGFSSRDVKTEEIRKNLIEMIEAGLPEEAALAALTIDGARLLGIERSTGTIEPGKLANLVVTEGSYFLGEDDPVRYVFVEGRRYEYAQDDKDGDDDGGDDVGGDDEAEEAEEIETPDAEEAGTPAGTWNLSIQTPDGETSAQLNLYVDRAAVTGRVTSSELMAPADIVDATFEDPRLIFHLDTPEYGRITARLDVSGDALAGTIDVPGVGVLEVSGSKVPQD